MIDRSLLKGDDEAAILQRLLGGFEQMDHVEPGLTVILGRVAFDNAVEKIIALELHRFGRIDYWRPHLTRTIADQQFVKALSGAADIDALVVHLDLLVWLEVVPHQHLVAAANERRADSDWRQPVDVDVRGN